MSFKNITVFETTYEKVLSIINKVKDFIKNNTKNFQSIIDELDWISKVITNKTLYSYDINKAKLSGDNAKFSDFLTKYNEEIINLNKKHILVRGILSFKTNKEFLKKPSLILKKISMNELTGLNYNDKNTINKQNPVNSFVDIFFKIKEGFFKNSLLVLKLKIPLTNICFLFKFIFSSLYLVKKSENLELSSDNLALLIS